MKDNNNESGGLIVPQIFTVHVYVGAQLLRIVLKWIVLFDKKR